MLKIERKVKLVGGIVMGVLVVGGVVGGGASGIPVQDVEAQSSFVPQGIRRLGDVYDGMPDSSYCVFNLPVAGVDVPWVASGYDDGGYSMVMAMRNVCTLSGIDCTTATGQRWGGVAGSGNNQSPNFFAPLDQAFDRLPAEIGGIVRSDAVRDTSWNMSGFSASTTPHTRHTHHVGANYRTIQSRLNLASYFEWMDGFDNGTAALRTNTDHDQDCLSNSLGARFIHARFGHTSCRTQSIDTAPNSHPPTTTGFNFPWLRSAYSSDTTYSWFLPYGVSESVLGGSASNSLGLLPVMWVSSDMGVECGDWGSPGTVTGIVAPPPEPPEVYDGLTVRAVVGEYIEIGVEADGVDGAVELGPLTSADLVARTGDARVFVSTNLSAGFRLELATVAGTDMVHDDTNNMAVFPIISLEGSVLSGSLVGGSSAWGWRMVGDDSIPANHFRATNNNGVEVMRRAGTANDYRVDVSFGAWASRSQVAGNYSVEVRFTAIGDL